MGFFTVATISNFGLGRGVVFLLLILLILVDLEGLILFLLEILSGVDEMEVEFAIKLKK